MCFLFLTAEIKCLNSLEINGTVVASHAIQQKKKRFLLKFCVQLGRKREGSIANFVFIDIFPFHFYNSVYIFFKNVDYFVAEYEAVVLSTMPIVSPVVKESEAPTSHT